jgi:predicted lipoprotein with Yx(FWY)xxD motif
VACSDTKSSPTVGQPKAGVEVTAGKASGFGTVLVDSQGFTLYILVRERETGTIQWTCTNECLKSRRPLTVPQGTSPVAGHGIFASKLGTAERPEGATQVTYNGYPLYRSQDDQAPGEANGLDVQQGWFLLSTAGAVKRKPTA